MPAPKPTTPPAPSVTPSPTPAAPASVPAATVLAPAAPPASASNAAGPRNNKGQFKTPAALPASKARTKVTAAKAFAGNDDLKKDVQAEIDKARSVIEKNSPVTAYHAPNDPDEVEVAPAAPVATVTPPPEPAAPPPEAKIKVSGKEYTAAELETLLADQEAAQRAAAAPEEPAAPAAPPPPPPSPEEIARREKEFLTSTAARLDATFTEEQLDTLLAGGKEALALFQNIRREDMARAILEARKGIADGMNPVMTEIFRAMGPLVQQQEQLQRHSIEQQFLSAHKDFTPHVERAREVAAELYRRYPQQVAKMKPEQFVNEVARQTDIILTNEYKRWNPHATTTWRDAARQGIVTTPTQAAVAANPAPTPAAPTAPPVRPPSANAPTGSPAPSGVNWQRGVANTLRG